MTIPVSIANSVIIGEDDSLVRGLLRSVLQVAEQVVFPAADGYEALTLARQFKARLVILDIAMPRLNGLLAFRAIRALPGYEKVPVIILSGYADMRMLTAAKSLGADDFITKPFRPDQLLRRLTTYLDIPARALLAASAAGSSQGGLPTHAQVWQRGDRIATLVNEPPELAAGREMIRIVRKAEIKR